MHAAGQAEARRGVGALQGADGVDPGSGGVDDGSRPHPAAPLARPGEGFLDLDPDRGPAFHEQAADGAIAGDHRALGGGAADIGQGQAGVVGQKLRIDHRPGQAFGDQSRLPGPQVGDRPHLVPAAGRHPAEFLEGPQAGAQLGDSPGPAGGDDEGNQPGQMGGDGLDDPALRGRLAHQGQVALGKIAQAAVDHLRGAAAGPGGEIAGLDQGHGETAHGGVAGDAGPGDAAADHRDIEDARLQFGEQTGAVAKIEGMIFHAPSVTGEAGWRIDGPWPTGRRAA